MKAGKALNERKVEIRVQYKPPAASIHGEVIDQMRNELVVRLLGTCHDQHYMCHFGPLCSEIPYFSFCSKSVIQAVVFQQTWCGRVGN